jgi:hypothetical protein
MRLSYCRPLPSEEGLSKEGVRPRVLEPDSLGLNLSSDPP